jgi:hypothetical protein
MSELYKDYYDSLRHICTKMCTKYSIESRADTYHICAYFNKTKIIIGENSSKRLGNTPIYTHAEMDVIRKMYNNKTFNTNKRIDKFDVLVIRVSKIGKLGSSRPCYHCISGMMSTPIVKINYVYYSTNDGIIVREKLDRMLESELTIVSTGWKIYTNIKLNNKSNATPKTNTSPKNNTNKMMQVINTMTGERELVSELEYQRNLNKKT